MQKTKYYNKELYEIENKIKTAIDMKETKKNIEYWESEVQKALNENDIMKAVGCRILANNLRKDMGEEEK